MMDTKSAAAALNGSEYRSEGSKNLFAQMKSAGLVAVFGASDDLMEIRGAVHDEVGCYGGGEAYFTSAGMFSPECKNDDCPHEERLRKAACTVVSVWGHHGYSWTYVTAIPHETFEVTEDGEPYCRGIVFALSDVPLP